MARPDYWKDCTIECESRAICTVCGRTKKPWGRDSRDNGLCDRDCKGYAQKPSPGHLWPGELAEMDKEDTDGPSAIREQAIQSLARTGHTSPDGGERSGAWRSVRYLVRRRHVTPP